MTETWNNLGFTDFIFLTLLLTRLLYSYGKKVKPAVLDEAVLWYSPMRRYRVPGFLLWSEYRGSKCKVSIFNSVFTSAGHCFSFTVFVAEIFKCSTVGSWMACIHKFFFSKISRTLFQLPVISHTSLSETSIICCCSLNITSFSHFVDAVYLRQYPWMNLLTSCFYIFREIKGLAWFELANFLDFTRIGWIYNSNEPVSSVDGYMRVLRWCSGNAYDTRCKVEGKDATSYRKLKLCI